MWISNARKRADKLSEDHRAELDTLGVQWTAGTARSSTS
ncbi:helicase [Streptomyces sp. NBC_00237]|nr:helicase [Streptomyces sp. NBC_00237]MCX5205660.1 helicase [Streptomyces sp. NBC_00237]